MVSLKRRVIPGLLAAAAALTLAGCAVPGQGAPGVAAQTPDVTVTLEQVDDYCDGLVDLGVTSCLPDWALTLVLVQDDVIDKSSELGGAWSDDEITSDIEAWNAAFGVQDGEVTPESVEVVRTAKAISNLATTQEGAVFLSDLAVSLESDVTASPRFGDFSADAFISSLTGAASTANEQAASIGDPVYIVFALVSGFGDANSMPAWFGQPEAVPSASAVPSAGPAQ